MWNNTGTFYTGLYCSSIRRVAKNHGCRNLLGMMGLINSSRFGPLLLVAFRIPSGKIVLFSEFLHRRWILFLMSLHLSGALGSHLNTQIFVWVFQTLVWKAILVSCIFLWVLFSNLAPLTRSWYALSKFHPLQAAKYKAYSWILSFSKLYSCYSSFSVVSKDNRI